MKIKSFIKRARRIVPVMHCLAVEAQGPRLSVKAKLKLPKIHRLIECKTMKKNLAR